MRARYAAASSEALITQAIRPQWIEVAIDIHQDDPTQPRGLALTERLRGAIRGR